MADLRAAALNADDITTETVTIPEWGGNRYGVKALTVAEQRAFLKAVTDKDGAIDRDRYSVQLIIATTVDPDTGKPVFDQADADALSAKSGKALWRLLQVANIQAGMGESPVEEAETFLGDAPTSDGD